MAVNHKAVRLVCRNHLVTLGTLPPAHAWENVDFKPNGAPYVEEEYLRGGAALMSIPLGRIQMEPMYVVHINTPIEMGADQDDLVSDVLNHFPPGLEFVLAGGDTVRVRADVAPSAGPMLEMDDGYASTDISIPLRYQTYNSI